MRTVILGERPPQVEALIESRRATGADLYDEVWEGDYHMAPAASGAHGQLDGELSVLLHPFAKRLGLVNSGPFNLGEPNDYRVPDRGLRPASAETWFPTAALVVEIVSQGDESWEKPPFYAAHGVGEVVIADAQVRAVTWLRLAEGEYVKTDRSELLGVDVAELVAQIDWPPTET